MSSDMDSVVRNGSINESGRSPEMLTTTASSQVTSTDGVELFTSAAIEKAVRRSISYAERVN